MCLWHKGAHIRQGTEDDESRAMYDSSNENIKTTLKRVPLRQNQSPSPSGRVDDHEAYRKPVHEK